MTTIVKTTCDECGDVEIDSDAVTVRMCVDGAPSSYRFRCPACRMTVVHDIDDQAVDLLVGAGAELSVWSFPAELFEAHAGPAIDHDDLLTFHLLLEVDGWFDEVRALASHDRTC